MNDLRRPLTQGGPGRPPENLDSLLRRFFRSEMPKPWPVAPKVQAPAARKLQPSRRWFRHSSRLALAAAVALFLIGYLVLARKFPADKMAPSIRPDIANKNRPRPLLPPKMPNRVNPAQLQGNLNLLPLEPQTRQLSDGGEAKSWGVRTGPKGTIYLNVERTR
jgi:hypothetical protein